MHIAYTRDIRNFDLTHPWATILDLQVYRDVWPEGGNGPKAVLAIKSGNYADFVSLG
jgi:hypothetical protein